LTIKNGWKGRELENAFAIALFIAPFEGGRKMSEFRVLLCGKSPRWRENLAAAFAENAVFEVAGSVASQDLVESAARLFPDVVLWKLEEENPLPVITELQLQCPFALPVLLVNDPKKLDLLELVRAGVKGCLPLRLRPRQMVDTVELIVKAGMLCLPRPGPEFFSRDRKGNGRITLNTLTGREREILSCLGKNLSNKEIARTLFLSEPTIKTHLRSIFRKLGVRNRTEALLAALRLGFLKQEEFDTQILS